MDARRAFTKSIFVATAALRRNKLQSSLMVLGMTIGVATVLTMIALGSGAQLAIQDQVRAAGMNVIVVDAGNYKMQQQWTSQGEAEEPAAYHRKQSHALLRNTVWKADGATVLFKRIDRPAENPIQDLAHQGENEAGLGRADTLSLGDAHAMEAIAGVQAISSGVRENINVSNGEAKWFTRLRGEGANLPTIRRAWMLSRGRFWDKKEESNSAAVVVLGSIVSERLFGNKNPLGQMLLLRGQDFRIIGVVSSNSWMVPAVVGDDQFDAIYLPVTSAQRLLARTNLDSITVSTSSTGEVTRVSRAITTLLRLSHHIREDRPDDFIVSTQARKSLSRGGMRTDIARAVVGNVRNLDQVTLDQLGKALEKASRIMTALLVSIAAVSLLVGGIGIMNIMLLSVTERTHEIGIRRAVGARSDEVLLQFLLEALLLSLAGGLLGILVGTVVSGSLSKLLQWSTAISWQSVVLSFGVSASVGVLFGYFPAREAARVSPMISLRYE